ncbi:ATP-dependent DNA helicase PIF1-like [Hydra vulgaris]|uniref:ATP-dependent DNA helicase n=1 Tax=Hydra vulgaris TaxID=6087 RepID=A0ABM4CS78_HYDVU
MNQSLMRINETNENVKEGLNEEKIKNLTCLLNDEIDNKFLFKLRINIDLRLIFMICKKNVIFATKKLFNSLTEDLISGGAGCGKSYLDKEIAQSGQIYKTIRITASTREAAYLLNGMTIHAFAGIEIGVRACKIKQCDDKLFGGKQIIACGHFLQLSPVKRTFVFKSIIRQQYMTNVLVLAECFRQKEDEKFFTALNEIRFGKVSDQTNDYLMICRFEKDESINVKYTRLFFKIAKVDYYNAIKMNELRDKGRWFYSKDVIKNPNIHFTFQIPSAIHLKINATVMLVRNISVEERLCNGTVGIVTLIEINAVWAIRNGKEVKIESVKEDILDCSHSVVASRVGLPLQLAFAFTVHKAHGSTIKKVVPNFNSNAFIKSLYYVSLSRVCNINDVYIIQIKIKQNYEKY